MLLSSKYISNNKLKVIVIDNIKREKALLNSINEHYSVISFGVDGKIIDVNDKFLELFDYQEDELLGRHHSILCEEEYALNSDYKKFWEKLINNNLKYGEFKRVKKNGEIIYIQASYKPLVDEDGKVFEVLKFAQDVTAQKLSNIYHSSQLKAIYNSQLVVEFDVSGNILEVNDLFLNLMNYSASEIIGKHHSLLVDIDYKESKDYQEFWNDLKQGVYKSGKFYRYSKDRKKVWIQATYTPILDLDGNVIRIVKFAQNITESENIKKDSLTNLGSRSKLLNDIQNENLNNLAIIDINEFALINDFYGYEIGDRIIIEFGKELEKYFFQNNNLYRIYGDKFAVYNSKIEHFDFLNYITNVMDKISEINIEIDSKKFSIKTTCGISFEENEVLLNTAEIINRVAKKSNLPIMIYSRELNIEKDYENNILWTEKIKRAICEDRIVPFFQGIYNNKTNEIEKYEALIRLIDEDNNIVSPAKFLDIAKKSKQYITLTKIMIEKSFKKFQNEDFEFSINLTVEDISDLDLKDFLFEKIKEFNIGKKLVIEIVESEKIVSYDLIYEFINEARNLGCKLAIDDFGSGYSNFEYLVKINADYVKIDGSIVKEIITNKNSYEIVKSIVSFCKQTNIKIIAEFISDKELFEKIKEMNIDYSQGFYLSEPSKNLN